jgi:hypothetical protein
VCRGQGLSIPDFEKLLKIKDELMLFNKFCLPVKIKRFLSSLLEML